MKLYIEWHNLSCSYCKNKDTEVAKTTEKIENKEELSFVKKTIKELWLDKYVRLSLSWSYYWIYCQCSKQKPSDCVPYLIQNKVISNGVVNTKYIEDYAKKLSQLRKKLEGHWLEIISTI